MEKTVFIEGMSCNHCKSSVEKALSALSGVSAVEVSLEDKRAVVRGEALDESAIMEAVNDAGFKAVGIE